MNLAWRRCETESDTWDFCSPTTVKPRWRAERRRRGSDEGGWANRSHWAVLIISTGPLSRVVCFQLPSFYFPQQYTFLPGEEKKKETMCCSLEDKVLGFRNWEGTRNKQGKKCLFIGTLNLEKHKACASACNFKCVPAEKKKTIHSGGGNCNDDSVFC